MVGECILCVCVCVCMCVCTAITKLGLLCELYTHNKKEMKKSEKQEVLEYLRGRWVELHTNTLVLLLLDDTIMIYIISCRVVVIVDQLSELLDLALDKYHSLTEDHKEELATYIIPEVNYHCLVLDWSSFPASEFCVLS